MFKKMKSVIAMMMVSAIICLNPLTVYAEDVTVDYIFTPDTNTAAGWYSASEGSSMVAFHDTERNENVIMFYFNDKNYYMTIESDCVEATQNGGLSCWGTLAEAGTDDFYGYVEVVWNSMESIDFPAVYILFGNNYVTSEGTLAAADYEYYGQVTLY